VNGLVSFWGWDSTFPPVSSGADVFDGVDPEEIMIACNGDLVEVTFVERGGTVTFDRAFNNGTGLWESSIDVINLWDYGDGDAGNSPTPPPQFERDLWSATFDAARRVCRLHARGRRMRRAVNQVRDLIMAKDALSNRSGRERSTQGGNAPRSM
jgi:hypothetical protein